MDKQTFQFSGSMEKRSVKTIDELNLSLYQPELFESIKRIQNLKSRRFS